MSAPNAAVSDNTVSFPDIEISEPLIRRFDSSGPRYTSYPTADRFGAGFDENIYLNYLQRRQMGADNPLLSVYVHLPFCQSLCYFCACNKVITQDHSRSAQYLDYLDREMALVGQHLGPDRRAGQLHLGGGTPTFLSLDELSRLKASLDAHFHFQSDAELGVEIDPR